MSLEAEIEALRSAAGHCRLDHVAALRVEGPDAFVLLDRVSTRPLFLRETQVCHTLFLREDAGIFADVFVALGEDAFYVLAEGPTEAELLAYLDAARSAGPALQVSVRGLGASHARIGIDGPYAWEVVAALLGPAVLGMPYLTLMHVDFGLCLRAGKTGEYGYVLLAAEDGRAALAARLRDVGTPLGLREVSASALDRCALESWHFCMRSLRDGGTGDPLTPLELQLQWRVGWDRTFVGAEALRKRRAQGPALRSVCVTAGAEIARGQAVACGGEAVGELLDAAWSFTRAQWVGMALVPRSLAHPHLSVLTARGAGGEVALRTQAPPLLDNRSLYVDPHRHSHRTREQDAFPPLVAT
jgi:glycine cleavage system aminomethyltransferase T